MMSEFKRQHPIATVTRLITVIKQNFVTLLILLFIGSTQSNGEYWLYVMLVGFATALFAGVFGWWVFKYRVYEDELQINKGIFVKSKLYLSKERIQVIDITEGLLQRMFGLVKVEIKTAGGGTESATISAISREEAERLRTELRKRSASQEESLVELDEVGVEEDEIQASWKLSNRDLIFAAFTSGNFGLIASILGAISGQMDQFINEETIDRIYELLPGYSNVSLIISVIVVIIFLSWLLSFLGVIFKYSDFKLDKTPKELIITSGLFERKHITIPFDRIQAIRFVEGILRQPFGYGMMYVESAGFEQDQQEKSFVLVPFIAANKLDYLFKEFLDDFHEPDFHIKPTKGSLFRYLRKPNYVLIIAAVISWFFWDLWWVFLLFVPLLTALGWLRYKDAALALGMNIIRMRFRILARTTALVKKNRVQKTELKANPFQRRKLLTNFEVTAASGAQGINFEISDLNREDALQAFDWVTNSSKH